MGIGLRVVSEKKTSNFNKNTITCIRFDLYPSFLIYKCDYSIYCHRREDFIFIREERGREKKRRRESSRDPTSASSLRLLVYFRRCIFAAHSLYCMVNVL